MKRKRRERLFKSETDLCASFSTWAKTQGWESYAETGDFDILLVAADGCQIGVQAKLGFNATLLRQAMPERYWYERCIGPDYRAILLPDYDKDVWEVCAFTGLVYFHCRRESGARHLHDGSGEFRPSLSGEAIENWLHWMPDGRVPLPEYKPDVAAGASAPTRLTTWKVGALRITARMEVRGWVTRADFRQLCIDYRRWSIMGWAVLSDGRYTRGPNLRFDQQHPVVYAEILAETKESGDLLK